MTSDIRIPRTSDIIARALDYRASAVRIDDTAVVAQIDRLIANLPSARLCWVLGTLVIDSPSGHTYHVTRGGCDCLNGQRSHKRQCWHVLARELLEDIFDTEAETADQEADAPCAVWPRVAAARSLIWARL